MITFKNAGEKSDWLTKPENAGLKSYLLSVVHLKQGRGLDASLLQEAAHFTQQTRVPEMLARQSTPISALKEAFMGILDRLGGIKAMAEAIPAQDTVTRQLAQNISRSAAEVENSINVIARLEKLQLNRPAQSQAPVMRGEPFVRALKI